MSPDLLGYVIEFSIGLAGFSGVIAVFAGHSPDRMQLELFRLRNLLMGALIPAILSFTALGIHRSIADETLAWSLSLSFSVACLMGYSLHAVWSRARMPKNQQRLLQNWMFLILVGLMVIAALIQVASLFGFLSISYFDAFYIGLIVVLTVATYQFALAVLDGVHADSAAVVQSRRIKERNDA